VIAVGRVGCDGQVPQQATIGTILMDKDDFFYSGAVPIIAAFYSSVSCIGVSTGTLGLCCLISFCCTV
jgi:hypothetical protein